MKLIQFIIVLGTGIMIGIFIQESSTPPAPDLNSRLNTETETSASDETINKDKNNPLTAFINQHNLEAEVNALREKVSLLEQTLNEQQQTSEISQENPPAEKLAKEILIQIGVTESIADDILNRLGQHEYQLLQLQDKAKREGYLNSSRYASERRKLMENAPSLQQALGKDTYDNYLYQTEQNNRVIVTAVMNDSPAAQLGVQEGDIILNYSNEKVLNWQELRELTGKGQYGDYVNLNILRDGIMLNILVPRGPLGVKLGATKIDPQIEYHY